MNFFVILGLKWAAIPLLPSIALFFLLRRRSSTAERRHLGKIGVGFGFFGLLVFSAFLKKPSIGDLVLLMLPYPVGSFLAVWEWGWRGIIVPLIFSVSALAIAFSIEPASGYFGYAPQIFFSMSVLVQGLVGAGAALIGNRLCSQRQVEGAGATSA